MKGFSTSARGVGFLSASCSGSSVPGLSCEAGRAETNQWEIAGGENAVFPYEMMIPTLPAGQQALFALLGGVFIFGRDSVSSSPGCPKRRSASHCESKRQILTFFADRSIFVYKQANCCMSISPGLGSLWLIL